MNTALKEYNEIVNTGTGRYKVVGSQLAVGGYCLGYAHLDTHAPVLGTGATPLAAYYDLLANGHTGTDNQINRALGGALIFLLDVHLVEKCAKYIS